MKIVISSGHSKKVRGAAGPKPWGLEEVVEARKVVEQVARDLRAADVDVTTYHDDVSTTQNENLNRIVDFHNSKTRDLDVSVHFNAYQVTTTKPMGTECLYVTQSDLAEKVALAVADAGDFVDRGPKLRSDLFFLNNTEEPAILIEICFVDSKPDCDSYRVNFDVICQAIADAVRADEEAKATRGAARDIPDTPEMIANLPGPLTLQQEEAIAEIAINSKIADYEWKDRGLAPDGYIKGFALAWASAYRRLLAGFPPSLEMALADTNDEDVDVLSWYFDEFNALEMNNDEDGPDTMRHLWALMYGLGMRESSGMHCEGRDLTADNVTAETAESGLFQTSYNAHSCSKSFDTLFHCFGAEVFQGFLSYFQEEVECSSSSWQNYGGSGDGVEFQWMCKNLPAFACESCAITLRNLRQHYGPINRKEVELKPEADKMLSDVQRYVDRMAGEV